MTRPTVAVIGECMVEVSLAKSASGLTASSLAANLSFGGDVLNTAVYLSRLGCGVDFVTAVGDDKISDWLLDQWQQEGVGCDLVERMSNQSPGMYMISTDATGERSFSYWRDSSPARKVFDDAAKAGALFEKLSEYPWLYFTGISLAILPVKARESLLSFVDRFRAAGGKVAFDSNFRPRLWPDRAVAKDVFNAVYERTDLALLTIEDEVDLFGAGSLDEHIARLQSAGIAELVLKQGPEGCEILLGAQRINVPAQKVRPVDTTSAGDAFNAGYLSQRILGKTPEQAAKVAHRLAAVVIQHPGAIVPKAVTSELELAST